MRLPDKFPAGCRFVSDFSGDDWVSFPDGRVFKLDDSSGELREAKALPPRAAGSDEAAFRAAAAAAAAR